MASEGSQTGEIQAEATSPLHQAREWVQSAYGLLLAIGLILMAATALVTNAGGFTTAACEQFSVLCMRQSASNEVLECHDTVRQLIEDQHYRRRIAREIHNDSMLTSCPIYYAGSYVSAVLANDLGDKTLIAQVSRLQEIRSECKNIQTWHTEEFSRESQERISAGAAGSSRLERVKNRSDEEIVEANRSKACVAKLVAGHFSEEELTPQSRHYGLNLRTRFGNDYGVEGNPNRHTPLLIAFYSHSSGLNIDAAHHLSEYQHGSGVPPVDHFKVLANGFDISLRGMTPSFSPPRLAALVPRLPDAARTKRSEAQIAADPGSASNFAEFRRAIKKSRSKHNAQPQ